MAKHDSGRAVMGAAIADQKQPEVAELLKKKVIDEAPLAPVTAASESMDIVAVADSAAIFTDDAGIMVAATGDSTGIGFGSMSMGTILTAGATIIAAGVLISELQQDDDSDGGNGGPLPPPPPTVVPTVLGVVANADSVNEGGTVSFTISTKDYSPGALVNYTISGVNQADISGAAVPTGTAQVDASGKAVITIAVTADVLAEGAETLTLSVEGKSDSVTINDTSAPPPGAAQTELRIGQDVIEGGPANENYTAPILKDVQGIDRNTLDTIDFVDGADGFDTLTGTLLSGSKVAPVLQAVESLTLTFAGVNASSIDLRGNPVVTEIDTETYPFTYGVQSITNAGSAAIGVFLNVGEASKLSMRDTNAASLFHGTEAQSLTLGATNLGTNGASIEFALSSIYFNDINKDGDFADAGETTNGAAVATTATYALDNSRVNFTGDSNVTTAAVIATNASQMSSDALSKMTELDVSGTGAVAFLDHFNNLSVLDGSQNSGSISAVIESTLNTTKALTLVGGSGSDAFVVSDVELGSTADLGAGKDTLRIGTELERYTSINGGDGGDTISITDGSTIKAGQNVTGFETIDVSAGKGVYDLALLKSAIGTATINESVGAPFYGVTTGLAGAVTLANAGPAFNLTVLSNGSASEYDLGFAQTIALKDTSGTADAVGIGIGISDGSTNNVTDGSVRFADSTTVNGVESLLINSVLLKADGGTLAAADDYYSVFELLSADSVSTLTLIGNTDIRIESLVNANNSLEKIDASALEGNLLIDAGNEKSAIQYLGSKGVDEYAASEAGGSITGGSGNDQFELQATAAIDTLIYGAATDTAFADVDANGKVDAFNIETIAGFLTDTAAGAPDKGDLIDLAALKFDATQREVLIDKGALAVAFESGDFELTETSGKDFFSGGGEDRAVAKGTFGGDTYVFVDANEDGNLSTADLVFRLDNVTNLALTDFNFTVAP